MKSLKPKNFIKQTEKNEQYECVICNYIAEKPYICQGRCGQTFCYQCMNCIRKNSNQCPFRCSKPFHLSEKPAVDLQFRCPFNPEECADAISSIGSFLSHCDCCKFLPANWKQKEENYLKYRCDKGHSLFFLDENNLRRLYGYGFFSQPTNSICSSCE